MSSAERFDLPSSADVRPAPAAETAASDGTAMHLKPVAVEDTVETGESSWRYTERTSVQDSADGPSARLAGVRLPDSPTFVDLLTVDSVSLPAEFDSESMWDAVGLEVLNDHFIGTSVSTDGPAPFTSAGIMPTSNVSIAAQTDLSVPALASALPLPWGLPASALAKYVVEHPELTPDAVAQHFGGRRRVNSTDNGNEGTGNDYPPIDDLSQCLVELAATVAVETVTAIKQKLFQAFVDSHRRYPSGNSVLFDCGMALDG